MIRLARLKHKAQTAYRRLVGLPSPWVMAQLGGKTFCVREGAVRVPEYDDAWMLACALRAKQVFDIGSNIGQAALIMLLSPSVEQITLVEPNPSALIIAAENLILNGLVSRARFVAAFADHKDDDEVTLWTLETGAAGSIYPERAVSARRHNTSIRVPTITLDTLIAKYGVPDLVKLDVEGAEMRALQGAAKLAQGGQTRFLVEMHMIPNMTMMQHFILLLKWCASVGYSAWFLPTHQRLPLQNIPDARCHVMLQPEGWLYPDWLAEIPMNAQVDLALAHYEKARMDSMTSA